LIEFGTKYCSKGCIDILTTHEGMSDDRNMTMVSFSITLELNEKFD